ncbi:MAG: biotin synthase BioB [Deltaproteobacteria bacterium]|nr:biotin synthase BioB [Deltaproteobacteria bacterium]
MDDTNNRSRNRGLEADALKKLLSPDEALLPLLHRAYLERQRYFGNRVRVHIINNAQNARCSEDCGYCAQSTSSQAAVRSYPWKTADEIVREGRLAYEAGAYRYCIVASGRGPTDKRIDELVEVVKRIKREIPIDVCCSLGQIDEAQAHRLKRAGVGRLNHNLNTSRAHYPRICTTHGYKDRLNTLRAAKKANLQICSGLIVGMGERDEDLVDVALELSELNAESIPVNFLIPIAGNRIQSDSSLTPERCLRVLSMVRLANPQSEVRVAAGREGHLRSLEALSLYPANSLFVEGYLTTKGSGALQTYRMIRDTGFVVERADGSIVDWKELGLDDAYRVDGSEQIIKPSIIRE